MSPASRAGSAVSAAAAGLGGVAVDDGQAEDWKLIGELTQ
jgi:hypothetical protein